MSADLEEHDLKGLVASLGDKPRETGWRALAGNRPCFGDALTAQRFGHSTGAGAFESL